MTAEDSCCYWCKSPFGCMNHRCQHHIDTERQLEADDRARRTHRDPVVDQVMRNLERPKRTRGRRR